MISTCPVCAAEVLAGPGGGTGATWRHCWNCKAQYQEPRRALPGASPPPRNHPVPDEPLETMLMRFEPYRREGRLLDVGFGEGQLLCAAAAEGWQCWGTETSHAALASGRRRGWRVLSGDLCRIGLPEALFDVICMAHVLEYLEQPAAYLREAIRLLRPGGLLYLVTASVQVAATEPPAHQQSYLQLFTTNAVRLALETAGYTHDRITICAAGTTPPPGRTTRLSSQRTAPRAAARLLGAALQQLFGSSPGGERLTALAERPH